MVLDFYNCFYLTLNSMSLGVGDVVPKTSLGKFVCMFIAFFGGTIIGLTVITL